MRVLVVAPDQPGLNTRPEVRQIQRRHHMSVLDGSVTPEDVYQCCRETAFQVIHFATHSGPEGVVLSNGAVFDAEDIAQVARLQETPCVFFNSCQSGKLASYAVRHGVRYAVHTNVDLEDSEAWKAVLAFYDVLQNGHGRDFVGAYVMADSGDGDYGLSVDPNYLQELQQAAAKFFGQPQASIIISRKLAITMVLVLLIASTVLATVINVLAGGL